MRGDCGDEEVKNEKLKIENADCAISIFCFSLNKTIGLNSGIDYSIKMKFDWPLCSLTLLASLLHVHNNILMQRWDFRNFSQYTFHISLHPARKEYNTGSGRDPPSVVCISICRTMQRITFTSVLLRTCTFHRYLHRSPLESLRRRSH